MGLMHVEIQYGNKWESYYMARVTLENICCNVGFFVARCLHHPKDIPFLPWHHREVPAEHHFSAVKDSVRRGMPKYKDMIHKYANKLNERPFCMPRAADMLQLWVEEHDARTPLLDVSYCNLQLAQRPSAPAHSA